MICIIALVIFSILAIFSASHRPLAKEAFECVFLRMTLRKCRTGLDTRLKSKVVGKIMQKSPKIAKVVYKNFEIFSWILVLVMIGSLMYSAYGVYNYVSYGNCNGPGSNNFCIYDAAGELKSGLFTECNGQKEEILYSVDKSSKVQNEP
ncbi:hypothetical protein JW851_02995 [Candidatus Woesearchaeota archaeon]|nr:hypothetical protein [Candidatus Woesearchaeota archaeon]